MNYAASFFAILSMLNSSVAERRAAQEVYWSAGAEPVSLDPTKQVDGSSSSWLGHIYEGLLTYDAKGALVPATAESFTVTPDKLHYVFKIRAGAKWHDGKPVRAQDYEFAFKRLVDPGYASIYAFIGETAGIANATKIVAKQLPKEKLGVRSLDDRTLEVTLEKPVAFFPALMAFQTFYPVREDLEKKFGASFSVDPASVVGNGPFKLVKWQKDATIRLEKAETYWNAAAVKLRAIESPSLVKDAQADFNNFLTGGIDYVAARSSEIIRQAQDSKLRIESYDSGCINYLSLNISPGRPFADKNLRRAVQAGINRTEFVNKIVAIPGNKPAYGFVASLIPGSKPGSTYRQEAPLPFKDADVKKAADYLAKVKTVPAFTILSGDSTVSKKYAEYWQNALAKLTGAEVRIENVPVKAMAQKERDLQYDISLTGWCPDYLDAMTFMDFHMSGNENNFSGWASPSYDELVRKAAVETDLAKRVQYFAQAEKIWEADAPSVPTFQSGGSYVVAKGLKGVKRNAVGISVDFRNAYWEP